MKIAFHIYSLEEGGGAERVVTNVANKLAKEGHQVFMTTLCQAPKEYPLDSRVKRVDLGLSEKEENQNRVFRYLTRIKHVKQFLLKERPDVMVTFEKTCTVRGLLATKGKICPVIGCVRNNPAVNYVGKMDAIWIKYLFPKAAGFIFQTEQQRDFFPEKARRKSAVILNPIHPKYTMEEKSLQRKKEVVNVGRIDSAKDQMTLLKAFIKVHEKHEDYCLKLFGRVGEQHIKEELTVYVKEHRAEEFIHFLPPTNQLEKVIKDASVFVLSSANEGFPNALMEAMALQIPVISTDCPCGGPATLIRDGKNGFLVPVGDVAGIAQKINDIIENPEEAEKMAEEAGKIVELANEEKVFQKWIAFLDEVVSDWKSR